MQEILQIQTLHVHHGGFKTTLNANTSVAVLKVPESAWDPSRRSKKFKSGVEKAPTQPNGGSASLTVPSGLTLASALHSVMAGFW